MGRDVRSGGTGRRRAARRHHTLWGGRLSLHGVRDGGAARERGGPWKGRMPGEARGGTTHECRD